jgi:hypothetical protein
MLVVLHPTEVIEPAIRRMRLRRNPKAALMWGATTFLAVQLTLALAIEWWLPQFRDPEYGRRLQTLRSRIASTPLHPFTIVMLGSSRTVNGFKASLVETELQHHWNRPVVAFNFGLTGAGPLVETLTLRRLLSEGVHPDLLLIEVLPSIFHMEHSGAEAAHLAFDRLWLRDLPVLTRYGSEADKLERGWWRAAPIPCFSHRYAILSQLAPPLVPNEQRIDWIFSLDQTGWVHMSWKWLTKAVRERALGRARAEYLPIVSRLHAGGLSCRTLCDLLQLCRNEKIGAALVLMPEGPTFRSWYSPASWEEFQSFLSDLHEEYGTPVINAREWVEEEGFFDSHHLLADGAEVFTRRLAVEVIPELIGNKEPKTGGYCPLDTVPRRELAIATPSGKGRPATTMSRW